MGDRIRDVSIFTLSSDFEGMPNALMEAMALGVPSISTDCPAGGARYLIEDKQNGVLVPVKNVNALVDAMKYVLSDSAIQEKLGNNARKICDKLNPTVIYAEWEDFIIEVASRK